MHLTDPTTVEEWIKVSKARGGEASIALANNCDVLAIYLSCYALETALKGFSLARIGSTKRIHSLRELREIVSSGVPMSLFVGEASYIFDIGKQSDNSADFTSLRYQADLPSCPFDIALFVRDVAKVVSVVHNKALTRSKTKGKVPYGK